MNGGDCWGCIFCMGDEVLVPPSTRRDPDFIPDPDMNPLVEDWIRMKREEAGGWAVAMRGLGW